MECTDTTVAGVTYYQFADSAAMNRAFLATAARQNTDAAGDDCPVNGTWGFGDDTTDGRIVCYLGTQRGDETIAGTAVRLWTEDRNNILGIAVLPDGDADFAKLQTWWNEESGPLKDADDDGFVTEVDPKDGKALLASIPKTTRKSCEIADREDAVVNAAERLIVASASSKTAIGLAYAVKADAAAPRLVALTSRRNLEKVAALGLYDEAHAYEDLAAIDAARPAAIVDMSGDGGMLAALHAHLGDNMRFTSNVGVTHYEAAGPGTGFIRERSAMFFAPGHIEKRAKDWGPGVFERKALAFWKDAAAKSRSWLRIERVRGMKGLEQAYLQVLKGRSSPDSGLIVEV